MSAAAIDLGLDLPPLPDIPAQLHRTSLRLLQAAMRAQLPGNLKLLLHTLCMHHNDQAGCAWPSVERLAKLCSTSTRTVQRNLRRRARRALEHDCHRHFAKRPRPARRRALAAPDHDICRPRGDTHAADP